MNRIIVNDYFIEIIADSQDSAFLHFLSFADKNKVLVDKQRRRDTYRCSLRALPELLQIMRPGYDPDKLPVIIRRNLNEELIRRERTQLLLTHGPDNIHPFLWRHQQLGVELAEVNRRYGFFYDTRTGKTLMALQIIYNALKYGGAKRALVICPSAIIQAWLDDAKHFPELKVVAYWGSQAERFNALCTPCHIMLWSMELSLNTMHLLTKAKFDICFIDESSRLKSHRSKTSKNMLELSLMIPRWYLLSATPAPNGEQEYYTQLKTIDPYVFPDAVTHFENKYFINMSRSTKFSKLVIHPDMKETFDNTIKEYAIYVDQSVMPTAGKEWHTVEFDMPTELRIYYDKMRSDMSIEVAGREIDASMAAAIRAKLNQIASGFVMDTAAISDNKLNKKIGIELNEQEIYPISDYRVKELDKLLKTFGDKKVVIWANYREEFRMIKELLGSKARYIRGGTDKDEKEEAIALFKEGTLQYLVCHPASIGMGRNFTPAHIAVYYSMTDSWELLKQSSERIAGHIDVQPNKCLYYVLQARNTIDEVIYTNVTNKRDSTTEILKHLEARFG